MTLDCEPVFDYGQAPRSLGVHGRGLQRGHLPGDGEGRPGPDAHLGHQPRASRVRRAIARTLVKEGETRFVALSWGKVAPPTTFDEAYRRQVWTAHHWQHWLARGKFPDHPWRAVPRTQSALTLKGLTYAPTGAITAAATTSLPETPHGERNWDYRYSWIRDSTFALWGLYTLGFDWEANDFMNFVADVAEEHGRSPSDVRGRRRAGARRADPRPPRGIRRGAPRAHRQRRVQPAPARRVGCGPRLVLPAHEVARSARRAHLADPRPPGHGRPRPLAVARSRDLGGARRAEALHLVEGDVLGRRRSRRPPGPHAQRASRSPTSGSGQPTRSTPRSAPRASTSAASSPSTTTPRRWTPRCSCCRSCASCPPTTCASGRRSSPSPTSSRSMA